MEKAEAACLVGLSGRGKPGHAGSREHPGMGAPVGMGGGLLTERTPMEASTGCKIR